WLAVGFVATLLLTGCARVHQVPHTESLHNTSIFNFTVSPDDRWIVFFERDPRDTDPSLHRARGLLCVLDTATMELHRFALAEEDAPGFVSESALWMADSSFCVFPRGVLIDLRDDANVKLLHGRIQRNRNGAERYIDETHEIDLPA